MITNHHQASITTSSLVTFVASGSLSRNGSQEATGKVVSKGGPLGFLEIFLFLTPKSVRLFENIHLRNLSPLQEQVVDEEAPTEEGLGLQMPKVQGLPENVDKV